MSPATDVPISLLSDPITDSEINAVRNEFGLSELDQDRIAFMKCLQSVDVSASPGSGKTTLVLAKLRILTQRWKYPNRGISLLSHTNVAKNEISNRFERTGTSLDDSGRPHFVGTIHTFLNRFLATPYLLSQGIIPRVVDDDIAKGVFASRARQHPNYSPLASILNRRSRVSLDSISLTSADLSRPFGDMLLKIGGPHTPSYRCAAESLVSCIQDGYLRYDDILLFAEEYLRRHPWVAEALRYRFPVVFIDEMQDTSQAQSRILNTIFPPNMSDGIVQRIGDPNQMIFGEQEGSTDFPHKDALSISKSMRISQNIAQVASPLAINPILPDGLQGVDRSSKHSGNDLYIITFEGIHDIANVLPTFSSIVRKTLTPEQLKGKEIHAVGNVHRERLHEEAKPEHFPRTVGEYHLPYKQAQHDRPPLPTNLREAAYNARKSVRLSGAVDEGLSILFSSIKRRLPRMQLPFQGNSSAGTISALSDVIGISPQVLRAQLLQVLCNEQDSAEQAMAALQFSLEQITFVDDNTSWISYLYGSAEPISGQKQIKKTSSDFDVSSSIHESNELQLTVGSIHSVKGETHAATLILDTYKRTRHIAPLLPWLTGRRQNSDQKTTNADRNRLSTCFVAMTRPTHLLAIAIAEHHLGKTKRESTDNHTALVERGWKIVKAQPSGAAL